VPAAALAGITPAIAVATITIVVHDFPPIRTRAEDRAFLVT
jgi:hypothetical protein